LQRTDDAWVMAASSRAAVYNGFVIEMVAYVHVRAIVLEGGAKPIPPLVSLNEAIKDFLE
jgi:hypothetical protein